MYIIRSPKFRGVIVDVHDTFPLVIAFSTKYSQQVKTPVELPPPIVLTEIEDDFYDENVSAISIFSCNSNVKK